MNKKQIVKSAVKKYTGKGGPFGDMYRGVKKHVSNYVSLAPVKYKNLPNNIKEMPKNIVRAPGSLKALYGTFQSRKDAKISNTTANVMKEARAYDNASGEDRKGNISDAGKTRLMARNLKEDWQARMKKRQK